jgi:uncharacterized protein YxjI
MASLSNIEFRDNQYTVKQKAVRNAYKVYDSAGNEVLSAKQKLMKMKEEFPFKDPQGNDVFSVKAEQVMDIAGDYAITDSRSGEKVAVLSQDFTLMVQRWHIEDPNGREIAEIESRGKLVGLLRAFSSIASLLPHRYTIEDSEGNQIGMIDGKFGLRDKYEIEVDEGLENKEAVLAAAVTIDALEGD